MHLISNARALSSMGRYREQLECAKEWYCLWNTKPTDPGAIQAAFALIDSCMANKEYADAHLYASTLWEIINHKHDNKIPDDRRQWYIARGAYFLALATLHLANSGGIPPEKKQKTGQEVIALARRSLDIHTQLSGTDINVANGMTTLADVLNYFNNDGNDEVIHLYEQAIVIYARDFGSSSVNMAVVENNLGTVYYRRAENAHDVNDLDREHANLELALPHYCKAARIYRAVGHVESADKAAQRVIEVEELLRQLTTATGTTATTATKG